MRQRLLTFPVGRRAKWAVMAVWLIAMGGPDCSRGPLAPGETTA